MGGIGEAQLHQRDKALAASQQLGIVPKLQQQSRCFFQRSRTVIVKGSRIHFRMTRGYRGLVKPKPTRIQA